MADEADKIVRTPDTLLVNPSAEEIHYRKKYLPDPKKLTNEKLVCTVCSKSLVSSVHKGEDLFIHIFLKVLVCEGCYTFYGDGCFSSDEDGDDKYCRWCGQGGTLYLCATCTCAFCQKCVKQNLKASVIAELEDDDWKCYVCNPRPLFGTRTICWGAQELNKIGKEKEIEKQKKLKERQEKINESRLKENERKSRKDLQSGESSKTKKRRLSDDDSSSPEVMPSKKSRRDRGGVNGSIGKRGNRRNNSSSDELDKKKKSVRTSKSKNNKSVSYVESSSEDDSDFKNKTRNKSKKKKAREVSSESSDNDRKKSKLQKSITKNIDSSDSDDGHRSKTKRFSKKQDDSFSEGSSDEKSTVKKKKKVTNTDDSSDDENNVKFKKGKEKKKVITSEMDDSGCENKESSKKHNLKKEKCTSSDYEKERIKNKGSKTDENASNVEKDEDTKSALKNMGVLSAEDLIVKKRIKLAILWLNSTIKDIAELGALISVRAKKFGIKKVNKDNLKTYDDVLNTVTKLKQLLSGVHSNYEHIEKHLEDQLKPWKVLIGKVNIDCETPTVEGEKVDKNQTSTNILPDDSNKNLKGSICKAIESLEEMEESETTDEFNESSKLEMNKNEKDTNISNTFMVINSIDENGESSKTLASVLDTSMVINSIDENGESSKTLASVLDDEEIKEKILHHSTPQKTCEKESESSKKSDGTVIKESASKPDKDESPQKKNKEDSGKWSKERGRKETEPEKEKLEKKTESSGQ